MEFVEEKTITLLKPVTLGKGEATSTYDHLDLREPTAGELESASKADTQLGIIISLIQLIAKVPRGVVQGLCQRDLKACADFLESFSGVTPPTTETSSPS
ncbi:MAG: phage tail assembly protein [Gallionella sp.]|nr:phage tail assembly protein [Gallionella sp.]